MEDNKGNKPGAPLAVAPVTSELQILKGPMAMSNADGDGDENNNNNNNFVHQPLMTEQKLSPSHTKVVDMIEKEQQDGQTIKMPKATAGESIEIKASVTMFLAAFGSLLGALSMGLALGYTAPAFLDMERKNGSSILDPNDPSTREHQKSLIGSTLAIGALVAALASEPCNRLLGRRIPLICCGLVLNIGWLLVALANSLTSVVLGRLLIGACCGIACGTAPSFVVEIAPPRIRGALGTGFQLMVVIGNLLASIFGLFLTWETLAIVSMIPSICMPTILFFMPESSSWLLVNGRKDDAKKALQRFRRSSINTEFSDMIKNASHDENDSGLKGQDNSYSIDLLKSREFTKPLLYALGLMFFQQFTGINAVLMYQGDIFKKASPSSDALLSTIWVCLAQVIATMVCSSLVDRLGRRILLQLSGAGSMLTLFVFGLYSYLSYHDSSVQQNYALVPLISLILFITFFSFGFGPIPWMMIPELTTPRVRSLIASFGACFAWTGAYIVTASMKPLMEIVGDAWTYWSLSLVCAISMIFIYILPETKVR